MKKFLVNCYVRFTTWRYLRKLKKFGYKFIFVLFVSLLFSHNVFALDSCMGIPFRNSYIENLTIPNTSPFWDTGYVSAHSVRLTFYDGINGNRPQINADEYVIGATFYYTSSESSIFQIKPFVVRQDGTRVNATCDGNISLTIEDQSYSNSMYYTLIHYSCDSLIVNDTFYGAGFVVEPLSSTPNNTIYSILDNSLSFLYDCTELSIPEQLSSIEELQRIQTEIFSDMASNWEQAQIEYESIPWLNRIAAYTLKDRAILEYGISRWGTSDLDFTYNQSAANFIYSQINEVVSPRSNKIRSAIVVLLSLGIIGLIFARRGRV